MAILPILPKLISVKLIGYRPLLTETVSFEINNGCFLIIGGNGLGKTTILQSIIYCLGGESDLAIEDQKVNRWGKEYFEGRLGSPQFAYISVDFYLGEAKISLTRGFRSKGLLSFKLNDTHAVDNPREADSAFESFLKTNAGYQNIDDFRFIVHKLCYLPENRANLVWNIDAQARLLMLLFSDIIKEGVFRERREQLKRLDSKRRHINVAVNNTTKDLRSIYLYNPDENDTASQEALEAELYSEEIPLTDINYSQIVTRLQELVHIRSELQLKARDLRENIRHFANRIEILQEQLAREEEAFILQQLTSLETEETKLAIHKLLHLRQCPACGSEALELSKNAQNNVRNGNCPLCGTLQDNVSDNKIEKWDNELHSQVRSRVQLEESLIGVEKNLTELRREEDILQIKYDDYRLRRPILPSSTVKSHSLSRTDSDDKEQTLREQLRLLKADYADTSLRFEQLQSELNTEYDTFIRIAQNRLDTLAALYQQYATEFLGIPCTLQKTPSEAKFLNLALYVPSFSDKVRMTADSCSEAQRFFLDIAFRMALIDLSLKLSGHAGSFVCETPENALDMTYINNVANMFGRFSDKGHSLLATSNIQPGALAAPILARYSYEQRRSSVLNLLEYGRLSEVQSNNLSLLEEQFNKILNGETI